MARSCVIDLDNGSVFDLHARLARLARSAIVEDGPALRAWGAWEFTVCDCQGNRVVFRKWAGALRLDRAAQRGDTATRGRTVKETVAVLSQRPQPRAGRAVSAASRCLRRCHQRSSPVPPIRNKTRPIAVVAAV